MKIVMSLFLLLICGSAQMVCAQSDPRVELKRADENYEKGQYQQAVEFLSENYDKCDFTNAEIQKALKILISSYHELDEVEKEMEFTRKFIKLDPVYSISYSSDPTPFIEAIDKFIVAPRWTFRFGFGFNKVSANVLETYSVWDIDGMKSEYSQPTGVSLFNPEVEYSFNDKYSIYSGININVMSYKRTITAQSNFMLSFTENIYDFKVPLMLSYRFHYKKRLSLAISAGTYFSRRGSSASIETTAEASATGMSSSPSNTMIPFNKSRDVSVGDQRFYLNTGLSFCAGLGYKYSRWTYSVSLVNSFDMYRYTKPLKYPMNTTTTEFLYADDDLKLSTFNLNFSIAYDISFSIKPKY